MPTYEYECEKCGLLFEEFQSMSSAPLSQCKKDACRGSVHRLISKGAGFILKGSGFYSTDYRSDTYKKAASADSSSSSVPAPAVTAPASTGSASTSSTTTPKAQA